MRLFKASLLLCTTIISTGVFVVSAQDITEFGADPDPFGSDEDTAAIRAEKAEEELIELKQRLRQIESMLLAQKDRENELLRDFNKFALTIQEQPDKTLAEAQQGIQAVEERYRADAAALQAKIQSLESAIAMGRERDIQMGEDMNKTIVITVSIVAGIGMLVFLVTVYLQYRLISRPMQPLYGQSGRLAIEGNQHQLPLDDGPDYPVQEKGLVENKKVEETNERFVSAIERLESKIVQMEAGLSRVDSDIQSLGSSAAVNSTDEANIAIAEVELPEVIEEPNISEETVPAENSAPEDSAVVVESRNQLEESETDDMDVAVLEEEGKRFLQKEDWDTAFRYYDQLVRLDKTRVDNWVNRGRALEMLKREDEAIASYDNAIHANPDLPSPFLYKAALLSRMERFEEAQKFYNEALSKVPIQKDEQATASAVQY